MTVWTEHKHWPQRFNPFYKNDDMKQKNGKKIVFEDFETFISIILGG